MTSPADTASHPLAGRPGLVFPIAAIYIAYGAVLAAAAFGGVEIKGVRLTPWDALWPAFMVVAGAGAMLRRAWGRWLGYLVSLPFLIAVPTGTLLGGYMIYHLTIYRAQFRRGGVR